MIRTKPRNINEAPNAPKRSEIFPPLNSKPKKVSTPQKKIKRPKKLSNAQIKNLRYMAERPEPQKKSYYFELGKVGTQPDSEKYTCHLNGYVIGLDESKEHAYFKRIFCGKEQCECCGHDGSITHQRRISRIFPKIMPLESVGYLVVTVPSFLREYFYSVKVLKDFKEYWKRKIKRDLKKPGHTPSGLMRYHWAGDDGITYKPHLNILINSAWIEPAQLEAWRHDLKFWFKNYFRLSKAPAPNLFYRYTKIDGVKYHKIKYITRATMRKFPDIRTKDFFKRELKNFKNTTLFGKFPKRDDLLKKDDQKIYIQNKCVHTGTKITWQFYAKDITKVVHKRNLEDKGLGMFYAPACHVFLKEAEEVSHIGKRHKRQKLTATADPPGEILKTYFPDKYIFTVSKFLEQAIAYKQARSIK